MIEAMLMQPDSADDTDIDNITVIDSTSVAAYSVAAESVGYAKTLPALYEPYAHLYVGDYFADTLDLAAHEHRALRLLLLETWVRGPIGNARLAKVARLTKSEWQVVKTSVMPLLRAVQPRIAESLIRIRAFDGQRLPSDDWHIVRSIVLERDGHACTYCGSDKQLEGDHIVPLSRGGSNAFANLATACRPCNVSKGPKTLKEWRATRPASAS
jgi:hypothetical protein